MKHLILAPLRGFTDAVFRNAFQRHFQGIDEALAPFVTSIKGRRIKPSHLRDLAPADNRAMPIVPQILSNNIDEFIRLANTLINLGYGEINWNLGCPYPMVAKKMRGSGLLPHPDIIDRMLEKTLHGFAGSLSIKTRLGRFSADEMDRLIPVFNRYPLARVIVHPRTGVQMYAGNVDLKAFESCLANISHPVIYNGDINDLAMFQSLESRLPVVSGWMLGRGLIANPFLPEMIQSGTRLICHGKARFEQFHDDLVDEYSRLFSGPGHVLDRMKGFWRYFASGLSDGSQILKKIRKAGSLGRYRQVVAAVLDGQDIWIGQASVPDER
ncbi:MAG: tRNA-dihydrouridine synthase family protein [Desulfosarcina sp.]|nr:tRNA-dihydrouridine synthase family protein [Desulfosarcina sp.]MBC2742287.1 tRNA-dihydrouridine synthase family protein [Desulfosarcina sp.]MBC2765198.1 tRNA-dihydrouridine synthase family protein [Desulfosarcina sp.]